MREKKTQKLSKKRPPFSCRKLKCNMLNHNTSIILYDKTCYIYNLPIMVTILVMWLFGITGMIIGMEIGYFYLAAALCVICAVLGYLFSRSFLYGKKIKEFSIDQIRKITCDREIVRIFLAGNNEMIEVKMAPRFQQLLLEETGVSLRTDFGLNPQVESHMLWLK